MNAKARPKLLIDCDPGHDDALALMLAQTCGDLVGVTTVSGNAPLAAVTENALALLALLDADAPVHAGAAGPLAAPADGQAPHVTHVHGPNGLGGVALPAHDRSAASTDAVGFLLESVRREPELNLVAIGPLTNVALAMEADASFAGRLASLSIMGGSTGTHQLKTSADFRADLAALGTAAAEVAVAIVDYLHARMQTLTGEAAAALHDPCAVLAVTHPELFSFETLPVAVCLDGTLTRGMTVIDQRWAGRTQEPKVAVAQRLDAAAAFELLLAACSSG